jgi:uncharacterized damage-inducible protein DinB
LVLLARKQSFPHHAAAAPRGMNERLLMLNSSIAILLLAATATPAVAQGKALADALARMHAGVARNVVESAEKMPEAEFGFQPSKDVRTFAGFVGHVANAAYSYCSRAKGEANPNKEDFEKVSAKAALLTAIKAATAYCDAVYKTQSDSTLAEVVSVGQSQQPRGQLLIQNVSHTNEHYGNLVTYMRLKGLVPPSTERATAARPGGND